MSDITVVTPAFNAACWIERNIRSVAAQKRPPAEHIIIDDGSTDGTVDIVEGLASVFPHIILHCQANQGAGAARNAGIAAAAGRYIAFLDSDDFWREGKLESQIGFMEREDVAFTYGDYEAVQSETGRTMGIYRMPDKLSYADFLRGCPIGCLTVAYDQQTLGKVYMPDVRRGQDWGLWLSLTRSGVIARKYPGCEAVYQVGGSSLSSGKFRKVADILRIYREQEGFGPLRAIRYLVPHVWGSLVKRPVV